VKNRFILLALTALVVGLLSPSIAQAHTVLVSSDPVAGSTVAQLPEEIKLTFANPLLTLGSSVINQVVVTDPMGATITSKNNVVHGAVLTNVLSPSMVMSGKYSVSFRVAAQDGHILNGSFLFFVGAVSANTADGPITVPASGVVQLAATASGKGVLDGVGDMHATASGNFTIDFTHDQFCYSIKTAIKDVTAAHIHAANQKNLTISDEIFLPLELSSINAAKPVCQRESGIALATLAQNSDHYVFMLHTKSFPDGAVAGPLTGFGVGKVQISGASLTATAAGGSSAIVLTLKNNSDKNVLITGFSAAQTAHSMIFYDSNMCQGNTTMTALPNILMAPGQSQNLGYKYQGAMLSGLTTALVVGESVDLTLQWNVEGASAQSTTFTAKVVKAPAGLHFGKSSTQMNMPGM